MKYQEADGMEDYVPLDPYHDGSFRDDFLVAPEEFRGIPITLTPNEFG